MQGHEERGRLRTAAVAVLLSLQMACGSDGDGAAAAAGSAVVRDSAGIVIVETPGPAARAPIGWTVDTVPDLELGGANGQGPEMFYRISPYGGIRGLPDGGILVVDGGSAELRYFDAEGRFARSAGGQGDGPGEFQQPRLVPYADPDSLLIQDVARFRFHVLALDGTYGRSFGLYSTRPGGRFAGTPQAVTSDGVLIPGYFRPPGPLPTGHETTPSGLQWMRFADPRVDTLARSELRHYYEREAFPGVVRMYVPFSTLPSAAPLRDGFFATRGAGPEVMRYDMDGRLLRLLRIDEPPRPVTADDVERARVAEAEGRGVPSDLLRVPYEGMDIPTEWPAFQSLLVDDLGWLWAREYRTFWEPATSWVVFDPEGAARGTIDLPDGLDVQHIGADYVLGSWRDALGVEHVRRYRLSRSP